MINLFLIIKKLTSILRAIPIPDIEKSIFSEHPAFVIFSN